MGNDEGDMICSLSFDVPVHRTVTQHLTSYIKRSLAWQYLAAVSLAYSGYTIPVMIARCNLSINERLLGHVCPIQGEKARPWGADPDIAKLCGTHDDSVHVENSGRPDPTTLEDTVISHFGT